jgi:hypothetical protein
MERKQIEMKQLKIAGLCLASMLVMSMALAGNASAALIPALWLVCLEGNSTTNTKYEDSSCTKPEGTGAWESVPLPLGVSDTVRILGITLRLTDLSAGPLKEKSTITCPHPTEGGGLIENRETEGKLHALILIKEAKVKTPETECTRVSGPCKAGEIKKVEGRNLPWKNEIWETEKKFVSKIEPDGNGEPGWAVECETLLGAKTDVCTSAGGELEETSGINRVTGGVLLVLAEFLKVHKANCTEGGAKSGEVEGQIAILLWKGNGLSLNI